MRPATKTLREVKLSNGKLARIKYRAGTATRFLYVQFKGEANLRVIKPKIFCSSPEHTEALDRAEAVIRAEFDNIKYRNTEDFPLEPNHVSVADALEYYLDTKEGIEKNKTASFAVKAFLQYLKHIDKANMILSECRPTVINNFIRHLNKHGKKTNGGQRSVRGIQTYAAYITTGLNYAQKMSELIDDNDNGYDFQFVKRTEFVLTMPNVKHVQSILSRKDDKKPKEIFDPKYLAALLNTLNLRNKKETELYKFVIVAMYTGARPIHILQGEWYKTIIEKKGAYLKSLDAGVDYELIRGTKRRPLIRLAPGLVKHLNEWQQSKIYTLKNNIDETQRQINSMMAYRCKHVGIPTFTSSCFRHTVATMLSENDVPQHKIFLGHATGITENHYVHASQNYQGKCIEEITGFMKEVAQLTDKPIYV